MSSRHPEIDAPGTLSEADPDGVGGTAPKTGSVTDPNPDPKPRSETATSRTEKVGKAPAKKVAKAPAEKAAKAPNKKSTAETWPREAQAPGPSQSDSEAIPREAADYQRLTLGDLAPPQHPVARIPTHSPLGLPLEDLDPEAFERLAAELVSRRSNSNKVHFYGRRGQAQYGLDIVEHFVEKRSTLYQVKRFQALKRGAITEAVDEYAGEPHLKQPRRFNPEKFVVITSAEFDSDTANEDELDALNIRYKGDLEIEVWGAETLSRVLRDYPRIVYAMFGPHWAQAWCGFTPTADQLTAPDALAIMNDPAEVLGVSSSLIAAAEAEADHPREAANLYRQIAETFDAKGFPAHASSIFLRESEVLTKAGHQSEAFEVAFGVARRHLGSGSRFRRPGPEELAELAVTDQQKAKAVLASVIDQWATRGVDLDRAITALHAIEDDKDESYAELCLLVAEYCLVDGLFDFSPPRSSLVPPMSSDLEGHLRALVRMITTLHSSNPELRARIQCAVADGSLPLAADRSDVQSAYSTVTEVCMRSGYLHATGLAKARQAYAHAQRGDALDARSWWRSSIKDSCEAGFDGDAREALLSISDSESGTGGFAAPVADLTAALSGDRRLLDQRPDPELVALESIRGGRLPDAYEDARRYIYEARISGQRSRERHAMTLWADVLEKAELRSVAVCAHIAAGNAKEAERIAKTVDEPIDVSAWLMTSDQRVRSAVIKVVGAQADRYPDELVPFIAALLIGYTENFWSEVSLMAPCPVWDAIRALRDFGLRIPEAAVDSIIELAQPTLQSDNLMSSDTMAELLVNAYCAVPERRHDLANALGARMQRQESTPELWWVIEQVPSDFREELIPKVLAAAQSGRKDPVACAARWNLNAAVDQMASRRAAAHLLRRPLNSNPGTQAVSLNEQATVTLLLGLLGLDDEELIDIDPIHLVAATSGPASGVIAPQGVAQSGTDGAEKLHSVVSPEGELCDREALVAAGSRAELVAAITDKFLSIAECSLEGSPTRVRTIDALRQLTVHLDAASAAAAVRRLVTIYENPEYSPIDEQTMSWDHGLSRVHMDMGQKRLRSFALRAAAEIYRFGRTMKDDPMKPDTDAAATLTAGAAEFLAATDKVNRQDAASVVCDLVKAEDVSVDVLLALYGDQDPEIRRMAVEAGAPGLALLGVLARDSSPLVRRSVALQPGLPEEIRIPLTNDDDPGVRRAARGE